MNVADTFPFRVLLNCDHRPDRRQTALSRLAGVGLTAERLRGRRPRTAGRFKSPAHRGHQISLLKAMALAERCSAPSLLFLEDDLIFHPEFEERVKSLQLPDDWRFFYFGGLHLTEPTWVSPGIVQTGRVLDTHAVAIRAEAFPEVRQILKPADTQSGAISDVMLSELHERMPTYAAYPNLIWQDVGFHSDISPGGGCNYDAFGRQTFYPQYVAKLEMHTA